MADVPSPLVSASQPLSQDDRLRVLGARDGYAHALVHLRMSHIWPLDGNYSPIIHPHHTRKLAARAAKLKPLREIEAWLVEQYENCQKAYEAR